MRAITLTVVATGVVAALACSSPQRSGPIFSLELISESGPLPVTDARLIGLRADGVACTADLHLLQLLCLSPKERDSSALQFRSGEGPSELRAISHIERLSDNRLAIGDYISNRIAIVDSDLRLEDVLGVPRGFRVLGGDRQRGVVGIDSRLSWSGTEAFVRFLTVNADTICGTSRRTPRSIEPSLASCDHRRPVRRSLRVRNHRCSQGGRSRSSPTLFSLQLPQGTESTNPTLTSSVPIPTWGSW